MITEQDLNAAIAECKGKRNPDSSTCIKLAAYYTIKRELYGGEKEAEEPAYSYAPAPDRNRIVIDSDTEFARIVDGMDQMDVMPVIDELMSTLQIIQPRLYNAVLMKLS